MSAHLLILLLRAGTKLLAQFDGAQVPGFLKDPLGEHGDRTAAQPHAPSLPK